MFCPKCRDEFREGIRMCPDCGIDLVEELPGESSPRLSILETTRDADRLATLLDQLEDARVPYVVEAGTALSLLDDEAAPNLSVPDPWEARIWIPGGFGERAAEAIASDPGVGSRNRRMSHPVAERLTWMRLRVAHFTRSSLRKAPLSVLSG